jgi:beta-lactam-binding protein with PASTA domain
LIDTHGNYVSLISDFFMTTFQKIKTFVWSRYFLRQFGFVLLFYLVIIGGTIFYLDAYTSHGQKIEVPNFVGKNINQVMTEIEELDLQYEIIEYVYDPKKPDGTIIFQDPEATATSLVHVKEGRIIRFKVTKSSETVEMPYLVDKQESFATDILKSRGLRYVIRYESNNDYHGAVLRQLYKGREIKEGEKLPVGATITLVVAQNALGEPVELPDLIGLTISEAQQRLSELGNVELMMVCEGCDTREDSLGAVIESQSPEYLEGIKIPAGSTISVQAKKGGGQ